MRLRPEVRACIYSRTAKLFTLLQFLLTDIFPRMQLYTLNESRLILLFLLSASRSDSFVVAAQRSYMSYLPSTVAKSQLLKIQHFAANHLIHLR